MDYDGNLKKETVETRVSDENAKNEENKKYINISKIIKINHIKIAGILPVFKNKNRNTCS